MKQKTLTAALALALCATGFSATPAAARDPFIGEVTTVGFNFCPRGWAKAEGQLLPIAQNTALFSLLGTLYGGDGRTTFGLPDLRGRTVVGMGSPGESTARVFPGQVKRSQTVSTPTSPSGSSVEVPGQLGMTVCIALTGIYPSRS